jgi:hypothetical protein
LITRFQGTFQVYRTAAQLGLQADDNLDALTVAGQDCAAAPPTEMPNVSCLDGIDNDCDGPLDCEDPDCEADPTCAARRTGACCDHDPFAGDCRDDVTQADCNCGACEWLEDQVCADVPCDRLAIPTVSSWGLVVMTLLLLTAAKIYFGRLRDVHA